MKTQPPERDYLDKCHNLVVLGGTFDPIHIGHLAIAEAVNHKFKPQRILFMPCGQPPHKLGRHITPGEHRYHMTALAIAEHPYFDISRMEIDRPGQSFTITTAKALMAVCPPGAEISFIIGADALNDILLWRDVEELLQICKFIVVPRPGYDIADGHARIDFLTSGYNGRFEWLDAPMLNISSTDIRERLANSQPVQGLIPKPVADYARRHALYNTAQGSVPCFNQAIVKLKQRLSPKRFVHTMGVVEEAERLAAHYARDISKARWAALLHDCTKEYSADKKRMLCHIWDIPLDETLIAQIDITHSLLSAESARRNFYVDDAEILQAIRYHTTGYKGMTMLDKIIMLADYTEPYRDDWGPIPEMRRLSLTNINEALIMGIQCTIKEETEAGHAVHPWSIDALSELYKGD